MTGAYDPQLLTTYPMKVSFLKEQLRNTEPWTRDTVGSHVVSTLGRIVEEGLAGGQTAYCVKDDLVNPGKSSRSFWEAMRILKHIENSVLLYGRHGCKHATLLCFYVFFNSFMLISLAFNHFWIGDVPGLIYFLIAPPYTIIISIIGLVWAREHAHYSSIHYVIKPLVWVYVFMLLDSILIFALYIATVKYEYKTMPRIAILSTIALLTLLNTLVIIIHVVFICVHSHEKCTCYRYPNRGCLYRRYFCCDLVFSSAIYREVGCCRSCRHNSNDDMNYV